MIKPNIYVKTIFDVDYIKLKENGIKLLCFDLDNTLDIPDKITQNKDEKIEKLFKNLEKKEFKILIISNNSIKNRVDSFSKLYNLEYIESAKKPFQKKYKKSPTINSFNKKEVAFIGDKIVTDVIGGNIFGGTTILVDPIVKGNTHWYTFIMNSSEKIFSAIINFKRGKYYD